MRAFLAKRATITGISTQYSGAPKLAARRVLIPPVAASGMPKVAIVGGGVSGCACASVLLKDGAEVTIFEMGRGYGGRASTRRTRDIPGLLVNHGAPIFDALNTDFEPLLSSLLEAGAIQKWNGIYASLEASTSDVSIEKPVLRYMGTPGMSSICEKLAEGATQQAQTMVTGFEWNSETWTLYDRNQQNLGTFDWVVVTGNSLASPRWRQTFHTEPPLVAAAETIACPQLVELVHAAGALGTEPVMIAMLAFAPEASECLKKLPFNIAEVKGHPVLGKIILQELDGPCPAVVIHSTSTFAEDNKKTFGSTSTAARLGGPADSNAEEIVIEAMVDAFSQLVKKHIGDLPAPIWGPHLHRWGNAFPEALQIDQMYAEVPQVHFSMCGDFFSKPGVDAARIETAALSGVEGANSILKHISLSVMKPNL